MATKKKRNGNLTIEQFLAMGSKAGPKTRENYRDALESAERWMGCKLANADEAAMARLMEKLRSMKSGSQYATVIRMFYRKIDKDHWALEDYLSVPKNDKVIAPDEILQPSDVEALIGACDSMRDRAYLGCLWDTGGRDSEVLGLRLKDASEATNGNGGPKEFVLWFRKAKVKGEQHNGYIRDSYALLKEWIEHYYPAPSDEAPLFPSYNGRFMSRTDGWKLVHRIAEKAKKAGTIRTDLKTYPHLFRHSRATYLLRKGVPEPMVKKLLGWKPSSRMLSKYSHLVSEDAHRAMLKAEGFQVAEDETLQPPTFENLRPVMPMVPPPQKLNQMASEMTVQRQELEAMKATIAELRAERLRTRGALAFSRAKELARRDIPDTVRRTEWVEPKPLRKAARNDSAKESESKGGD